MKNKQPTNSNIVDPKCGPLGFTVGDWDDAKTFYAAVPAGKKLNKLAVVHQAEVLKVCNNQQSARNFIERHRKKRSVARLPV